MSGNRGIDFAQGPADSGPADAGLPDPGLLDPSRLDPIRLDGDDRVWILDGATGTELERRGIRSELPLWSTHALLECPDRVEAIHAEYVAAGADLLTANTFRTQARTLARAGMAERAAEITARAVALARRAAGSRPGVRVLGSAPPLEDCFRPDLVPDDETLAREHAAHAENLAAAGVDAILVETMNTLREAIAATRAAREVGLPAIASFTCDDRGRLRSGEPLERALASVTRAGSIAVGVNCVPPAAIAACLGALAGSGAPFLVSPNQGPPRAGDPGRHQGEHTPEALAALAREWQRRGARILGGCCGTTPAHTRALAKLVAR